jgi:hypothetical protein
MRPAFPAVLLLKSCIVFFGSGGRIHEAHSGLLELELFAQFNELLASTSKVSDIVQAEICHEVI